MMLNKLSWLCALLLLALIGCTPKAEAKLVHPVGDGVWYYSIGGGDPLMYYHQSNKTTVDLSVGVEWNLMRGCSFDPSFSISETFSDIEHNLYGLAEDVIDSAVASFSAWGLQKIQEAWPGLYDTVTKGLKDAKESYTVSLKTCRDVKQDLEAGNNPIDGWIGVTRKSSWDQAAADGENPVEVDQEIEEYSGNAGVVWVGGARAGGRNSNGTLQPPIKVVEDIVGAGYAHLADTSSADDDDVTGDPNITRAFKTKADAVKWSTEVVGEREVRTCTSCGKLRTKMGQGLRFQFNTEREKAAADFISVIDKATVTADDLEKLSVPGMGVVVNLSTINYLKQSPPDEGTILFNRLVGEIALARAMEKALIVRDLMNAGAMEPNVGAVGEVALAEINYARDRLQTEIDNVLFEADVRKKVITNAAHTIAVRGNERITDPAAANYIEYRGESRKMRDGAIENND